MDEREAASIEAFVAHVDALVAAGHDPCSEDAGPVHVTGSGIVVGPRGVLLLRHRRLGIWVQPGGHVEPGETPWDGARRETQEETGLHVEFVDVGPDGVPVLAHVDVHPGGRGHTHLDLRYLLDGGSADPAPPAGESQDVEWLGWDEAIARADPGLRGALVAVRW